MISLEFLSAFLKRSSYLDDIIQSIGCGGDMRTLQLLLRDKTYSAILMNKFFFPDMESLLRGTQDISTLHEHIERITENMNCWFNCIRCSTPHVSEKLRILYVYSGCCVCRCGSDTLQLEAGETCVVPAGQEFSHTGLGEDCLLIHALISPDYFQKNLLNKLPRSGAVPTLFYSHLLDAQRKTVQHIRPQNSDSCEFFMLHAFYEGHSRIMYYYEPMESYLVLFITELLRALTVSVEMDQYARNTEDRRIMDIRRYIDANRQRVTLRAAAEHFHFTPSYLSQFVSKAAGETFTKLVQESRLLEATRLLLHSTMRIAEIGSACGYQNTAYFYRIFFQKFGCTPSEYRQRNYGLEAGNPVTISDDKRYIATHAPIIG